MDKRHPHYSKRRLTIVLSLAVIFGKAEPGARPAESIDQTIERWCYHHSRD
jgi:hypothetical protein